jgi:ribosomal protein S18 acetylase RimI-like enzyme
MLPIVARASLSDADTRTLYDGLLATDPVEQPRAYASLGLTVHDGDRLVAGLMAATVWRWLSIDVLWVSPELRGQGYGRRLVTEAETVAQARGCRHARVDTFDFQARTFYEQLGYRIYGELPDFPDGHRQFHLFKHLVADS